MPTENSAQAVGSGTMARRLSLLIKNELFGAIVTSHSRAEAGASTHPKTVRYFSIAKSLCASLRSWLISPAFMPEDRKTLEQRLQMTDLERLRHSTAHVLATAILKIWPDAQFAAGPPVENGFYYDVELSHRISPEDFPKIEAEMKKEIKANHVFEKKIVTREQATKDAQSGRLG